MKGQVAAGHGNTSGLHDLYIQPFFGPIGFYQEAFSGAGYKNSQGAAYTALVYSMLARRQFNVLVRQFGLSFRLNSFVESADITLAMQIQAGTYSRFNAIVDLPSAARDQKYKLGTWRDVNFVIRSLEWISDV